MKTFRLPHQSMYPKEIHFSKETYRIVFKKRKNWDRYAETDAGTKTITIKDGLNPRELFFTFIHELLHVIEFEKPLKITHKLVYKLEEAIGKMILDNFL